MKWSGITPGAWSRRQQVVAEGEGFEPPLSFDKLVFKTSAFSHSANPPHVGPFRYDGTGGYLTIISQVSTDRAALLMPPPITTSPPACSSMVSPLLRPMTSVPIVTQELFV